jgi:hypothetical protein
MNTKKIFETKNLTIYKKLLQVLGDYKCNTPCTGVDRMFDALINSGASILPKDKLALNILDHILNTAKNPPAAVQALLNTSFACLPAEFKPITKGKDSKHEIAMWTVGKTIYDRVKNLINWEADKQVGNWTDINGIKVEIIDMSKEVNEAKVKTLSEIEGRNLGIEKFPNFSVGGSIKGMKKQVYGKDALLVRCGSYIYNVSSKPEIYNVAR